MQCIIDTWRKLLNFALECKGRQTDKHTTNILQPWAERLLLVPKTVDELNAVINF